MDELKSVIAQNIVRLRQAVGLTQLELGQKLNYTDKAVSKWERAESVPDVYSLKQLADLFGVSVDYLLTEHGEHEKIPGAKRELKFRPKVLSTVIVWGIITVAVLLFIIFWMIGSVQWSIFIYALPVIGVTTLVLNSVWNGGKNNMFIVSFITVSLILTVYVILLQALTNLWQILLLAIPAEAIVILSFHIKNKKK